MNNIYMLETKIIKNKASNASLKDFSLFARYSKCFSIYKLLSVDA